MLLRWLAGFQPSTGCPECMTTQKVWEFDWGGFNYMAHSFFLCLPRILKSCCTLGDLLSDYEMALILSYSLALFCISLASFIQDAQSKRRICFQHGRSFPVKWMFIRGKKHARKTETHLPNGPTGWDMLVRRRVGTFRTSLKKLSSSPLTVGQRLGMKRVPAHCPPIWPHFWV